ncbi:hypothetical protein EUGRSUZ_H04898 [Eucalyptus grandis]|uniref:cinnamyl-alcohol dehydrogenase n=2 Tax=Eucalyptus grandis TaxID=71139 RepID=A0A059B7Y0_EUCGR|nr:hypothetical protein EUGRSUZ_H04898 [Eucalyptus grandis]
MMVIDEHYVLCFPDNKHLNVAGLGGLGHVAVKMGKAFGLKVTVISSSSKKEAKAIERLGAPALGTIDDIIDTVSAVHPLLPLLKLPIFTLVVGGKLVGGSDIGGMKETQQLLDFRAEHGITADVEVIRMDYINTAMERLAKSDVRYRFVIDAASSLSQ